MVEAGSRWNAFMSKLKESSEQISAMSRECLDRQSPLLHARTAQNNCSLN